MAAAPDTLHQKRRWAVLGAYAAMIGLSQLLWLNFAPLIGLVQKRYGVSELWASSLVLVFPLLYVFFSLPAGALVDRRGYRFAVGAGALLMTAFSFLRIFDQSFWLLFAGQFGIAIGQPFVMNGISKLVGDWFSEAEGALATGLGTMGMFVGMAVGMAATPELVEAFSLRSAMVVFFGVSVALTVLFFALVHPNPGAPPQPAQEHAAFTTLLRNRAIVLLCAVGLLGLGEFNGLTTWLEQILGEHGVSAVDAGLVGGALILGGIVGSVVTPLLSDKLRRRKPVLLVTAFLALLTLYPLCQASSLPLLITLGAVHGFFFLPAAALLLDMTAAVAGTRLAGAATGLFLLAGNAGAVVMVVALPLMKDGDTWHRPVLGLVFCLVAAVAVSAVLPETFPSALGVQTAPAHPPR